MKKPNVVALTKALADVRKHNEELGKARNKDHLELLDSSKKLRDLNDLCTGQRMEIERVTAERDNLKIQVETLCDVIKSAMRAQS